MILATLLGFAICTAEQKPLIQGLRWSIPVQVLQDADTIAIVRQDSASPSVRITSRVSYSNAKVEIREILKSFVKSVGHYRGELVDSASGRDVSGVWWFRADFSAWIAARPFTTKGLWAVRSGRTTELLCVMDSANSILQSPRIDTLYSSVLWEKLH